MYSFIAFFCPSIVGVKIIDHFFTGLKLKNYIYYFAVLVLISTMVNSVLTCVLFDITMNILESLEKAPIFFCKYTCISIFMNVILAFMFVVAKKNISLTLEVERNGKEKRNKKNK